MNRHRIDDRTLTVEPLTQELRAYGLRGRPIPSGTPARHAVVQRSGQGRVLSIRGISIEAADAVMTARVCASNDEGRYVRSESRS
jgi:hypothetical protein